MLIVTARMYRWEESTRRFLSRHNVPFDEIYMRGDTDYRPDVDVKRDIYRIIREDGYRVAAAIDDNPAIVALWESLNIPTTIVPGWEPALTPWGENWRHGNHLPHQQGRY